MMIMKGEYIKNRKGAVMAYFKILSQPLPGDMEENLEKTSNSNCVLPKHVCRIVLPLLYQPQVLIIQFKNTVHPLTSSGGMLFITFLQKNNSSVTLLSTYKGNLLGIRSNSSHVKETVK
jgi:hypothetical protein